MAFNSKGITIEINANVTNFDKAMRKIKNEVQGIDKEMTKLKRSMKLDGIDTKSFGLSQDLLRTKVANLTKQSELQKTTISQLEKQYQSCGRELQRAQSYHQEMIQKYGEESSQAKAAGAAVEGYSKQYSGLHQSLQYVQGEALLTERQVASLSAQIMSGSQTLQSMYVGLGNVAEAAGNAYNALKPISLISFAGLAGAVGTAMSFESAWTGVTKTVEGTPEQLAKVNDGLKELATSTASSYEDIAHFAELGGQMGVATDSVLQFTKTVAMLGDTTNIVGEDAAQSMAKFANVMVDAESRTADYYERFGSTVVDLGNNFATTEADIVEMATRLGTAGRQVGMTSQEVLALSTALSSMGIKAAAGGGSMSKLIKDIQTQVSTAGDDLELFAETAGMSAEEFSAAWRDDAGQAFAKFLEGIGKSEDVTAKLAELGIEEVRMSNATGALAQSTDVYTDALERANTAWDENTAMQEEASRRYETTASAVSQAWEAIKQLADGIGQTLLPYVKNAADFVKDLAQKFNGLSSGTKDLVGKFMLIGTALAPATKGIQKVADAGQLMIRVLSSSKKMAALTSIADGATEASSGVVALANTFKSLLNPVTLVVGGVAALAAGFVYLKQKGEEYTESCVEQLKQEDALYRLRSESLEMLKKQSEAADQKHSQAEQEIADYETLKTETEYLTSSLGALLEKENLSASEKALLAQKVERLNELYPGLNLSIDENTGKLQGEGEQAITTGDQLEQYAQKVIEAAEMKAFAKAIEETSAALVIEKGNLEEAQEHHRALGDEIEGLKIKREELSQSMIENGTLGSPEEQAQVQELTNKIEGLERQYEESGQVLSESAGKVREYTGELDSLQNRIDTLDTGGLSQRLHDGWVTATNDAREAGVNIPYELSEGIRNGTAPISEQVDYISTLMQFQSSLDETGRVGGLIPVEFASHMLENAGSLTDATNSMNNMLDFAEACENAGVQGGEWTNELASAITEGGPAIDSAVKGITDTTKQNFKDGFVIDDTASEELSKAASTINSNTSVGSAAGSLGDTATKQYKLKLQLPKENMTTLAEVKSQYGSSGTPSAAATMGARETSSYSASLRIYSETRSQVDAALRAINELKAAAANPIEITTVKTTVNKTVTEESGKKSAPVRRTLAAINTLSDTLDTQNVASAFALTAPSLASEQTSGLISATNSSYFGLAGRLDSLNARMSNIERNLNMSKIERTLDDISGKVVKNIVLNGKLVGQSIANEVRKANLRQDSFEARLMGG